MAFESAQSSVTIATALQSDQLSKLRKENSQEVGMSISRIITFYNNKFNLTNEKKLNIDQILYLSNEILTKYWYLKFDEIVFCFREGVTGRFGKIFGSFDAMTVHLWFSEYIKEREAAVEQKAFEDAQKHKESENDFSEISDEYLQVLKKATNFTEGEKEELSKEEKYRQYRNSILTGKIIL